MRKGEENPKISEGIVDHVCDPGCWGQWWVRHKFEAIPGYSMSLKKTKTKDLERMICIVWMYHLSIKRLLAYGLGRK